MAFGLVSSAPAQTAALSTLAEGASYATMDDAINSARVHAQKQGFSYKVSHRNKSRAVLKCSGSNCQAYTRLSFSKKLEHYVIGKLKDEHSCQGTLQASRGSQRDHEFLVSLLRNDMIVNKNTPVKDVQRYLKQRIGSEIAYTTAHKAKETILNDSVDAQRSQFSFLHSYVDELLKVDPDTIAKIETREQSTTDGSVARFHSIFVAPGAARHAFTKMRPFLAVDGTFTKNRFIQILLLAVGMDSQDQIVVLAWAVVPNESFETWSWFLQLFRASFPSSNESETVVINDREKGLLNAVQDILPRALNAYCCWHIGSNVQTKFGLAAKRYVRRQPRIDCVYHLYVQVILESCLCRDAS